IPARGRGVVLGARLVGDCRRDPVHQTGVESGCKPDDLGKNGGDSCAPYAMKRLIPPVIFRYIETLNSLRIVQHLTRLLLKGQTSDKIPATLINGEVGVTERKVEGCHRRNLGRFD